MGLFAKIAGGLISSIAGKKAQKKMAGAYQSSAQQMPVFTQAQQNAMRDRYAQMASGQMPAGAMQAMNAADEQALSLQNQMSRLQDIGTAARMSVGRGFSPELSQGKLGGIEAALLARMQGPGSMAHMNALLQSRRGRYDQLANMQLQGLRAAQGMQGARQGMMLQGAGANAAAGTMIPGALGQVGNLVYQDALNRRYMNAYDDRTRAITQNRNLTINPNSTTDDLFYGDKG